MGFWLMQLKWTSTLHAMKYPPLLSVIVSSKQQYCDRQVTIFKIVYLLTRKFPPHLEETGFRFTSSYIFPMYGTMYLYKGLDAHSMMV